MAEVATVNVPPLAVNPGELDHVRCREGITGRGAG